MVVWMYLLYWDRLYTCYLRLATILLGGVSVGTALMDLDEILDDFIVPLHPPSSTLDGIARGGSIVLASASTMSMTTDLLQWHRAGTLVGPPPPR